jgi:hypothetical protein
MVTEAPGANVPEVTESLILLKAVPLGEAWAYQLSEACPVLLSVMVGHLPVEQLENATPLGYIVSVPVGTAVAVGVGGWVGVGVCVGDGGCVGDDFGPDGTGVAFFPGLNPLAAVGVTVTTIVVLAVDGAATACAIGCRNPAAMINIKTAPLVTAVGRKSHFLIKSTPLSPFSAMTPLGRHRETPPNTQS